MRFFNWIKRADYGKKNKILIVLHTSTSHGPAYSKKYPSQFETFKPVCNSVELGKCSQEELINAYDNTIVYTDYILHRVIEDLKQLKDIKHDDFRFDHGESLAKKSIYAWVLISFAPKEQYEIPFYCMVSDHSRELKTDKT
jgi:lipid A ethanolaminephosphotransferase